jgi:flagellar basal body-associated protein FliL
MTLFPNPRKSTESAFLRVPFLLRFQAAVAALIFAASTLLGCYDAAALLSEKDEAAVNARLEEVDLGAFHINLPHVYGQATDSFVDFHAFGQVAEVDRHEIQQALEMHAPEIRSRMLVTIRSMKEATFQEPKLDALRQSIAHVINAALNLKAIQNVGFYSFTFGEM